MTIAPMHKVIFFALDAAGSLVWDEDDIAVVDRIHETEDFESATRVFRAAVIAAGGNVFAASLSPAVARFDSLADYLTAQNVKARLTEEFPEEGTFVSALTEDLSHWAEIGVTTPQDLADYLDGCFQREMQKAAYA
ncbi:hypothetical protein ACOI1H_21490 [Loktanella sp. DJP18]|uniref:hypothetical protein n=1 Tax=Loktanella sp. DJP18 TaxID=3409788 RepID=UPI003BB4AC59